MRRRARLLTLLMAALLPSGAWAQEAELPPVEFGAVGSAFGVVGFGGGGMVLVGGGPTVTIGLPRRIRLDVRAEILGPQEGSGLYGLYETQVRFPLLRSSDDASSLSLSAGVGGALSYYRFRGNRTTRPDGSIVVYPGYRRMRASPPRLVTIGIAHQHIVSGRASAILGADAMIGDGAIVARATAGVAFGARRYR